MGEPHFTGAYTFMGKSTLQKKTPSSQDTTLEKPKGMHVILGFSVLPKLTFDIAYALVKYEVDVNSASASDNRKWQDIRFGGSLHF
jgi:hypothetical protein